MLAIEDTIRGLLKVHGLKRGIIHRARFSAKVNALLGDDSVLRAAIGPLLEVRDMMRKQKAVLDRQLAQVARKDDVCKRLMTVSGVGSVVSLSFKATVDDPKRFKDSKAVAAHLRLTPRVYQSGEIDRSGHVRKCGDKMKRQALYEAANSHLQISKKWSVLRAWESSLQSASVQRKRVLPSHARSPSLCIGCGVMGPTFASVSRPLRTLPRIVPA